MPQSTEKQTLGFQTEVKQVLNLMIHSLYSNKEIFLRELISNAADAADKLRFEAIAHPELYENNAELAVHVDFDAAARIITISDNGIGMTRDEVISNLGTIAKSGTKEFLAALSQDQSHNANLIGQFGVGFYSSFIVADKVTVLTRKAGLSPEEGVRWESKGDGEFTVEPVIKPIRGTEIILHLKEEEAEFLDEWRLKTIIRKYSDHVPLPVIMKKKEKEKEEDEVVNKATALWNLPKNEIKDSEYNEFYKYVAHDFDDPLAWAHNKVEGKQEYTSLLYIPSRAPFDLYHRERHQGLKLYVKRVFIMDDVEQFLPFYLRFVKGVLDANDLPLNVSREILQQNKQVESIRAGLTKRVLTLLEKMAQDEKEKYTKFWSQFGNVLKEGPAEDQSNKELIAKLLRFSSTHTDQSTQTVSLDDYISRMQAQQKHIYYVTAESFAAAKNSPQLEIFRKKGIEVLLMHDRVDEWLTVHLTEYQGKQLHSVSKGKLDLDEVEENKEVKQEQEKAEKEYKDLVTRIKETLGDRVTDVRITHRLTTSPACIVIEENEMGLQMQRILQAAGQTINQAKPILELNPQHPLVVKLNEEHDPVKLNEWSHILLGQSILAEGGHLDDPAQFVQLLNKLLM
ncbi:MAG: molecular chaperone HtpG [Gammaproteobacteria bacterium]|nr:molecular chaperone HtpG [Gammaproteobacteria bacterium]